MANSHDLNFLEVLALVELARSEENTRAFRAHSKQLIAFSVLAIVYGRRTKWAPTDFVSEKTKLELSQIARNLQLEKVAYQTFAIHMRRMIRKFCDNASDDLRFLKVKNAINEQIALKEFVDLLGTKNIFTASHMRTWSGSGSMDPLDLTRQRKEVRDW